MAAQPTRPPEEADRDLRAWARALVADLKPMTSDEIDAAGRALAAIGHEPDDHHGAVGKRAA